ncbi:Quinone-dependent D-lactate dehydrogenase (D-lactate dehydrogenase) (D-LDH), partial [Durusdinium trenchii]
MRSSWKRLWLNSARALSNHGRVHGESLPWQANEYSRQTLLAVGGLGLLAGFMAPQMATSRRNGHTCGSCECEVELTEAQKKLPEQLKALLGAENVKSNVNVRGSRLGKGTAMLVLKPGTLREALQALELCAKAEVAVLPQGANTSLTGGSVPRNDCDRPFVIINMRRAKKIMPVGDTPNLALCFAGAGIFQLQTELQKRHRDSHSVLGSMFLNPSVAAGVSYGSGGTQIRKGPAFTDRALFCRVKADGEVELVDTLGLKVKGEKALDFLDSAESLTEEDLDSSCRLPASWPKYREELTKVENKVSRFNADTTGVDCNRSEGKVLILATLHDTFPMPKHVKTVWASCKDIGTAHQLKREVCISSPEKMAKSCEYINRATYDAVDQSGRILIKMIELLGMMKLEPLWNLKLFIESIPVPFSTIICDKFLWWFNNILPKSLPKELQQLADEF